MPNIKESHKSNRIKSPYTEESYKSKRTKSPLSFQPYQFKRTNLTGVLKVHTNGELFSNIMKYWFEYITCVRFVKDNHIKTYDNIISFVHKLYNQQIIDRSIEDIKDDINVEMILLFNNIKTLITQVHVHYNAKLLKSIVINFEAYLNPELSNMLNTGFICPDVNCNCSNQFLPHLQYISKSEDSVDFKCIIAHCSCFNNFKKHLMTLIDTFNKYASTFSCPYEDCIWKKTGCLCRIKNRTTTLCCRRVNFSYRGIDLLDIQIRDKTPHGKYIKT